MVLGGSVSELYEFALRTGDFALVEECLEVGLVKIQIYDRFAQATPDRFVSHTESSIFGQLLYLFGDGVSGILGPIAVVYNRKGE